MARLHTASHLNIRNWPRFRPDASVFYISYLEDQLLRLRDGGVPLLEIETRSSCAKTLVSIELIQTQKK